MPTIYEPAGDAVEALARRVMKQYRGDLCEVNVTVSLLMASSDDGAAVKLHGYPCAAVIKINGYKDRVEGKADATIVLDGVAWNRATPDQRVSLLDHELHHLELKRDKKSNAIKVDDLGRPKLGMKLHDHEFGWFDTIAHRHGDASFEVRQAKAFADANGQTYFGWHKPPAAGSENATAASGAATMGLDDGAKFKDPDVQRIDDAIGKRGRPKAAAAK